MAIPVVESSALGPIRAQHPQLLRDATVAETFSTLVEAALEHLERNAQSFKARPEPHAVHQMRVATRRLRALLGAFRSVLPKTRLKRLALDMKRLQSVLSPARDLDVFLDAVLPAIAEGNIRAVLARAARIPHRRAYARVGAIVRGKSLVKIRHGFTSLVAGLSPTREGQRPGRGLGRKILVWRHRALVRRLGGAKQRSDQRLHALRIRIKKLRYEVEFFRPLMPKGGVRAYHAALAESQDVLGAFNDAVNARVLARKLTRDLGEKTRNHIDAIFAKTEERARPLAKRKFAHQHKGLKKPPKRWFD